MGSPHSSPNRRQSGVPHDFTDHVATTGPVLRPGHMTEPRVSGHTLPYNSVFGAHGEQVSVFGSSQTLAHRDTSSSQRDSLEFFFVFLDCCGDLPLPISCVLHDKM